MIVLREVISGDRVVVHCQASFLHPTQVMGMGTNGVAVVFLQPINGGIVYCSSNLFPIHLLHLLSRSSIIAMSSSKPIVLFHSPLPLPLSFSLSSFNSFISSLHFLSSNFNFLTPSLGSLLTDLICCFMARRRFPTRFWTCPTHYDRNIFTVRLALIESDDGLNIAIWNNLCEPEVKIWLWSLPDPYLTLHRWRKPVVVFPCRFLSLFLWRPIYRFQNKSDRLPME